MISMETEVKE